MEWNVKKKKKKAHTTKHTLRYVLHVGMLHAIFRFILYREGRGEGGREKFGAKIATTPLFRDFPSIPLARAYPPEVMLIILDENENSLRIVMINHANGRIFHPRYVRLATCNNDSPLTEQAHPANVPPQSCLSVIVHFRAYGTARNTYYSKSVKRESVRNHSNYRV